MKERPSAYLVGKCEALEKIVDFFGSNSGSRNRSLKDKRTIFLSQIDFWDWEMDELIYSVTNFNKRVDSWESFATLSKNLSDLKIPIDRSILGKIESDRGWDVNRLANLDKVVAPIDILNKIISKWNKLIDVCQSTLLMDKKQIKSLQGMKVDLIDDLQSFKKKPI